MTGRQNYQHADISYFCLTHDYIWSICKYYVAQTNTLCIKLCQCGSLNYVTFLSSFIPSLGSFPLWPTILVYLTINYIIFLSLIRFFVALCFLSMICKSLCKNSIVRVIRPEIIFCLYIFGQ